MKHFLSLILSLLFAPTMLWAEDISVQQALQIAKTFSASQQWAAAKADGPVKQTEPQLAHSMKSAKTGKDNVYVVNLGQGQGFVIVSGNSETKRVVLGWCDHGSFDYDNAPVQLKDLLYTYSCCIDSLNEKKYQDETIKTRRKLSVSHDGRMVVSGGVDLRATALAEAKAKAASDNKTELLSGLDNPKVLVAPLLKSYWNQDGKFAKYIDPYFNGWAGCVPTAMAQIMKYWEWPKKGRGFHLFNVMSNDNPSQIAQWIIDGRYDLIKDFVYKNSTTYQVNFSKTEYKWDKMGGNYPETDEEWENVATVIRDCHITCSPIKLPNNRGTGANESNAISSLILYFGYDASSIQHISAEKNIELLKQELNEGRPVFVTGNPAPGAKNPDGHAMIFDGYAEDDYFHVDFGWGGSSNGYYQLGYIITDDGSDFGHNTEAYIGIRPAMAMFDEGNAFVNINQDGTGDLVGGYQNVVVSNSYTVNGKGYHVDRVIPYAFKVPSSPYDSYFKDLEKEEATSIVLPEGVTEIGEMAFASLQTSLKEITLPSTLRKIGPNAFWHTKQLEKVTIPKIENWFLIDFEPYHLREDFDQMMSNPFWSTDKSNKVKLYEGDKLVTDITVPGTIKEIKPYILQSYRYLNSVILEEGVEKVGKSAFEYIPLTYLSFPSTLKEVGQRAFYEHEVKTLNISSGLIRIGNEAFYGPKLAEYKVDEKNPLYSSYQGILYDKARRTLVHCPEYRMSGRKPVARTFVGIPSTVDRIRSNAFSGNLREVTIPPSVRSIEVGAFTSVSSRYGGFSDIRVYTAKPLVIGEGVFSSNISHPNSLVTLHVPVGSADAYRQAKIWKDLNIVEDIPEGSLPPKGYDAATNYNAFRLEDRSDRYNGTKYLYFFFEDNPVITYSGEDIIITTKDSKISLAQGDYNDLEYIYMDNPTDIEEVIQKENAISIRFDGNNILIKGIPANEQIALYSINGELISRAKTTYQGEASISLPDAYDIVVVKAGKHSLKIHSKK